MVCVSRFEEEKKLFMMVENKCWDFEKCLKEVEEENVRL